MFEWDLYIISYIHFSLFCWAVEKIRHFYLSTCNRCKLKRKLIRIARLLYASILKVERLTIFTVYPLFSSMHIITTSSPFSLLFVFIRIKRSFRNIGIEDFLDHKRNLKKHFWHQQLFISGICHFIQQKSKFMSFSLVLEKLRR